MAYTFILTASRFAYHYITLDLCLLLYSCSYAAATCPNPNTHATLAEYSASLNFPRRIGGGVAATTVGVYVVAYTVCLVFLFGA